MGGMISKWQVSQHRHSKRASNQQAKIEVISRVWSSCLKSRKEEERAHKEDKQTQLNESSQHDVTGTNPKKQHRKEAHNIVNNHHIAWHDAQSSMMHVRFNEAWHGKMHKQFYKLSGAQYAMSCILTEHHINYLVLSRLCTQQY